MDKTEMTIPADDILYDLIICAKKDKIALYAIYDRLEEMGYPRTAKKLKIYINGRSNICWLCEQKFRINHLQPARVKKLIDRILTNGDLKPYKPLEIALATTAIGEDYISKYNNIPYVIGHGMNKERPPQG